MKNINCWLHLLWSNSNIAIRTIMIIIGQRINAKWYQTAATTTPKIRWKVELQRINSSLVSVIFTLRSKLPNICPIESSLFYFRRLLLSGNKYFTMFLSKNFILFSSLVVSLLLYPRVYLCRSWASPFFYILFLFSKQISHLSK